MSSTLVSRRGPGPVGQFQTVPVKTILRFLTIPYICAQRILYLAREVQVFHMTSTHIARQALHLVILLNDSVDATGGPNEEQQDERVDLGDDLIELEVAMKQWGTEAERQGAYDVRIPDIKQQYAQFFKRRFYFHNARDPESDPVFQKLLAYDNKTTKLGFSPRSISHPNNAEVQTRAESDARVGEEPNISVFESNQPLDQRDVAEIATLQIPGKRPSPAVPYNSDRSPALRGGGSAQADMEKLMSRMAKSNTTNPRAFRELKRRAEPIAATLYKSQDTAQQKELLSIFTTMADQFGDGAGGQLDTVSSRMDPRVYMTRKRLIMNADEKLNQFQAPPKGRTEVMRKATLDDANSLGIELDGLTTVPDGPLIVNQFQVSHTVIGFTMPPPEERSEVIRKAALDDANSVGIKLNEASLQADVNKLLSEVRKHNTTNPRVFRELGRRVVAIVAYCDKYGATAEKNELCSIFTAMADEFIDAGGGQSDTISNRMNPHVYLERKKIIMRADQRLNKFQAPPDGRSDVMRKANLDDANSLGIELNGLTTARNKLLIAISQPIGSTAAEPAKPKARQYSPQAFMDSKERIPRNVNLAPIFIPEGMGGPDSHWGSDPPRSPSPEEEGHTWAAQTTAAHLQLETKLLNVENDGRTTHSPPKPVPKDAPVSIPRDTRGLDSSHWRNDPLRRPSPEAEHMKLKHSEWFPLHKPFSQGSGSKISYQPLRTFHKVGQASDGGMSQWVSQAKTAYEHLEKKLVEVKGVDLTPALKIPISDMCFENGTVTGYNISLDQTFGELADIVTNNDVDAVSPDFWSKKIDHDQNRVTSSGVTWEWQDPSAKVLDVLMKERKDGQKESLGIEKVTKEGEYVVALVEKDGKEGPMPVAIPRSHRQSASKHFQNVVFPDDTVSKVLELQSGEDASKKTFDRRFFSPFTNSVFIEVHAGSHEGETSHSVLRMNMGVKSPAVNPTTIVRGPTGVKEKQRIFGSKMAAENVPGMAELQLMVASAEGNSEPK